MFKNNIKKIKGFLAVEFALVFTLLLFFLAHFMLLAFTLTQIFITQYISFAMAREYFAGHENEYRQEQKAHEVYEELSDLLYVLDGKPFGAKIASKETGSFHRDLEPVDAGLFDGVQLKFITRMIQMSIPFIDDGKTAKETEFTIGSYIGREPTTDECDEFFRRSRRRHFDELSQGIDQFKMPNQTGENGC